MTARQVSVFTDKSRYGDNSPEGIHQDGAGYIVSALVVERKGITGGMSYIFGPDKKTKYFAKTLQQGEGLFQADKGSTLWHTVTKIKPDKNHSSGFRNIIGFDINILE